MRIIIAIAVTFFVLSACGKGNGSGDQTGGSMDEAPAQSAASSAGMTVVDHTKDEQEFKIKRELWGVESMIEDYKQHGYDTSSLEQRKAELEQELNALNN